MHAPETRAAFERAGEVATAAGDPMEQFASRYGQRSGELARGDVRRMLEIAAAMEPVAARETERRGALIARRALGLTHFSRATSWVPIGTCNGWSIITILTATMAWRSGSRRIRAPRRDIFSPSRSGCSATWPPPLG